MPKRYRKSQTCHNCGTEIKDYNFCPECGQINTHKQVSFKELISDLLGDYFTFDSKFFKSFVPLIKQPGHLTTEYLNGRRTSYILPMRLFVFTSALFFFIMALNSNSTNLVKVLSEKHVPNQKDTLNSIINEYDNVDSKTRKFIIRDIVSKYDLSLKEKINIQKKQKHLSQLIDSLQIKISSKEKEYFLMDLDDNFVFVKLNKWQKKYQVNDSLDVNIDEETLDNVKQVISNDYDKLKDFILKENYLSEKSTEKFVNYVMNDYIVRANDLYDINESKIDTTSFWGKIENNIDNNVEKITNASSIGWELFKSQMINHIPKIVFIMLPLFALILKLIYLRSKILYISHLVFSLHIHSVFFIYMLIPFLFDQWYVGSFISLLYYIYLFIAFKKVYQQKSLKTFIKLNLVLFLYLIPMLVGITGLAFYTILSI